MKKKQLLSGVMALLLSASLCACGGSKTAEGTSEAAGESSEAETSNTLSEGTPVPGGSVVYGMTQDLASLDPHVDTDAGTRDVVFNLYEGLVKPTSDGGFIPAVASDYTISDDAKTYTFTLRDGITFHDGTPVTIEDVKYSIDRYAEIQGESSAFSSLVDSVEVQDDKTLVVNLKESYSEFLPMMTIAIIPQSNEDPAGNPIGTGPYKLDSWDAGQAITLVKNEDYFKGTPNIDKIIFKIVPDDNAKAIQMQSGELDLALLTPKDAKTFADQDGYTCYDMKTSDYRGILYNFNNDYWTANKDIIPAINYAIDRQAIIDAVLLGQGMTAYGPLQRNIYNNENVEHYDYDPEKSKEIMESVGCTMGEDGFYYRDGEKIGFVISVGAGDQVRLDIAQAAAQQLKEVGIDCTVEVPTEVDWGGQMAYLIGWGSPFDADDHTYKVFGTDKGANYSSYSNALVDQYLIEARESADPAVRAEAYDKFQEELAKDPAFTFICYIDANYVANSSIQGISADTVMGHHGVGIFWNVADWTIGN